MKHVPEYFRGVAAVIVGGGVTIKEILTNGSLLLTFGGALLAVIGGYWAYRTSKTKAKTAEIELRMRELELQKMIDRQ